MTGGEAARFVLDAAGFNTVAVDCHKKITPLSVASTKQLLLSRELYEGQTLLALARGAREALFLSRTSHSFFMQYFRAFAWYLLSIFIYAAWLLWLLGLTLQAWAWLAALGTGILGIVFFLGVIHVTFGWDGTSQLFSWFQKGSNLDVDELIRLKQVLEVLRFDLLAAIYIVPWDGLMQLTAYLGSKGIVWRAKKFS